MNKIRVYLPLIFSGLLILGILVGIELNRMGNGLTIFGHARENKINEVINYVKNNYVDTVNK